MGIFDALRRRTGRVQAEGMGGFPVAPQTPFGRTHEGGENTSDVNGEGGGYDPITRIQEMGSDTAKEAAAMGRRMSAEQAMRDAGIQPNRIRKLQEEGRVMTRERLNKATQTLMKYKDGKNSVNRRVINAQNWWKLRNWQEQEKERGTRGATDKKSNTAWLWNCIVGKHADAIDSYPEPVILPRAEDDKDEANKLSKIVPVVLQMNGFEQVYSDAAWQKMQEGTAAYGIFWDPEKLNGLGDIDITNINILNLYWEPGVQDIQDSQNLFYVHYEDRVQMEQKYPQLEAEGKANKLSQDQYKTDDHIDTSDKLVVIDWYYHTWNGAKKILQYCQYVGETVIYSSEEENANLMTYDMGGMPAEDPGFYAHGKYPFVLDVLFPVQGSPAGYGYIDIAKDTQMDIDKLSQALVQNTAVRATPRYFARKDGSINEAEFTDWSKPIVHCGGMLGEDAIRVIETMDISGNAISMLQQKIDELKFITGNTDVNNGGVPSGVTAASAIAALKEDSGRSSKDSSKASYRSFSRICDMVIELIRQFYDIPRQFRITGDDGQDEYTTYSNAMIKPQVIPNGMGIPDAMRLPVFDIDVRAQRENAYTKMSQNELAIQFYQLGVLLPQNTDQALMLIDMMDFRGKEELRKKLQQNGTIRDALMQVGQIAMALAQKYQPQIADQLGMMLQGIMADSGMAPPVEAGGGNSAELTAPPDNTQEANPGENKLVAKARERAANASRPN